MSKENWEQCKTKIKSLKNTEIKDHNGETGRGRKTFKFYDELDVILGHRPASVPSILLDTGTISSTAMGDSMDSEEESENLIFSP